MRRIATLLVLVVIAGCGAAPPEAAGPPASPGTSPSASASRRLIPVPQLLPVDVPAARRPARLQIPAIGVDTGLETLGIRSDRTIDVPKDPAMAGWLRGGPAPGDPGPAIVAGHVDSRTGPAVFYRLSELKPGQVVTVRRGDRSTVQFRIDSVEQFSKSAFPTAQVYGPAPVPSLRLITCAGAYDKASGYRDNIVVFASRLTASTG